MSDEFKCPIQPISGNGLSTMLKSVGAVAAMVALVYTLTRPMIVQMEELSKRMERVETRMGENIDILGKRIDVEIKRAEEAAKADNRGVAARLDKLEIFQKWWYETVQPIDQRQDATILNIQEQLRQE